MDPMHHAQPIENRALLRGGRVHDQSSQGSPHVREQVAPTRRTLLARGVGTPRVRDTFRREMLLDARSWFSDRGAAVLRSFAVPKGFFAIAAVVLATGCATGRGSLPSDSQVELEFHGP